MATNIKDLCKMKAKKKKKKKKKDDEKKNNRVILHFYKNYFASLFLDLFYQVFPQYV